MLFVFESTDQHSFHMKNTFIPLDIAFINEEGIIESIKELNPQNPVPVYPDGDIRYAIEVNRGWFAENGVVVGDTLLEDIDEEEIITEVKDKKGNGSGTKDACYHKVKSRYSVWPSAYASGALVKCRKVGAANWGNSKKEEVEYTDELTEKAALGKIFTKGLGSLQKVSKLGQKVAVASGGVGVGIGAGKLVSDIVSDGQKNVGIKTTTEEFSDWRQELDEKCWPGYEKKGMKTMFGKRYPNCVKKSKKKK